jgi:hypothetical protein
VDERATHTNQAAPLGIGIGSSLQHERAQLIRGTAVRSRHEDVPQ